MIRLHLPDEPVDLEGDDLESWLWDRWRVLDKAGFDRRAFSTVVCGYRRELWLWSAGERTWEQCCSGLLGRIGRRVPS